MAASEAKVWGKGLTLRKVSPAQKKHIHDRVSVHIYAHAEVNFNYEQVIGECPSLKGHTREIDAALRKALNNANYHQGNQVSYNGTKEPL